MYKFLFAVALSLVATVAQAAGTTGVVVAQRLVGLVAGDGDLGGIDDDDEVTGVDVGGVLRLVLAAQEVRGIDGHLAQDDVLSVDDPPVPRHLSGLGAVGGHRYLLEISHPRTGVFDFHTSRWGCGRPSLVAGHCDWFSWQSDLQRRRALTPEIGYRITTSTCRTDGAAAVANSRLLKSNRATLHHCV